MALEHLKPKHGDGYQNLPLIQIIFSHFKFLNLSLVNVNLARDANVKSALK